MKNFIWALTYMNDENEEISENGISVIIVPKKYWIKHREVLDDIDNEISDGNENINLIDGYNLDSHEEMPAAFAIRNEDFNSLI